MFEVATKTKLRFTSLGSNLSVEDVWDLPLVSRNDFSLDNLYKSINRQIKAQEEESYVASQSKASEKLNLQLEIVKHIIDVKKAEKKAREDAVKNQQLKEQIGQAIARKQEQDIDSKSLDELQAMYNNL